MKINRIKNQKIWISSDLHFNHTNIIKYCGRNTCGYEANDPVGLELSVQDMNETIIKRHNSLVKEDDYYICAGDIGFGKDVEANVELFNRLNGQKLVCWGNHDYEIKWFIRNEAKNVIWTGDILNLRTQVVVGKSLKKQSFVICHFPLYIWNGHHKGVIHLFGHSHGTLNHSMRFDNRFYLSRKCMDIGLDTNNLFPYNIDDVSDILKNKEVKFVDHHDEETN